jgi:DNA polymerase-3 subunit alpha
MITALKPHVDRNKRPMAFVTLEDMRGTVESTVFADLLERSRVALYVGAVIEARGRVNVREEADPKMVLASVRAVNPPGAGGPAELHLDFGRAVGAVSLEEIRSLLIRHPGESPVYFRVPGDNGGDATTIRARRLLVRPSEDLLAALRERVGADAVTVTTPSSSREASGGRAEAVPF